MYVSSNLKPSLLTLSDTELSRSDRPSIGDWMGTWWLKKARIKHHSIASHTTDSLSETDKTSDVDILLSLSSEASSIRSPKPPTQPRHRKTSSRSVFGALGFSLLNPSSSPGSSHRRRNMSVADIPAITTDPEVLTAKVFEGTLTLSALASPLFGSFLSQQPKPSKPSDTVRQSLPDPLAISSPQQPPKAGLVALESIFSTDSKPPTQYLSRTCTSLTSRDFHFSLPVSDAVSAASLSSEVLQEGMTDRFGFIYDVSLYDALLLLRAERCENTAPACLTGIKVADRREDDNWSDDAVGASTQSVEIVKEACDCDGADAGDTSSICTTGTRPTLVSPPTGDSSSQKSRPSSPNSTRGRPRSSTVTAISSKTLQAKSSASILSVDVDTPTLICPETIKKMLAQLKQVHDQCQARQRKEWNVFVNQRSKSLKSTSGTFNKTLSSGGRAATMLGLRATLEPSQSSRREQQCCQGNREGRW
ncbi:hypothetical protein BC835DRAFT_1422453 [Cytidiella melzeri]|nr:hypothetical protein BC835DRAFT_1422453 [Cytidiella melzeri]